MRQWDILNYIQGMTVQMARQKENGYCFSKEV